MRSFTLIPALCLFLALGNSVSAQDENPFNELVSQQLTAISDTIADPVASIFSAGATGGWYRSAATHKLFGFEVGGRITLVQIPTGESSVFDSAEGSYFPAGTLQAAVGLPFGLEATVRGFGLKFEEAKISLFGAGIKKNFKSFIPIPGFPDVAAFIGYQKFKAAYTTFTPEQADYFNIGVPVTVTVDAADLIHSAHWTFGAIASKKFSLLIFSLQPYVGLTFDKNTLEYKWTLRETVPDISSYGVTLPIEVSSEIKSNLTKFTLGLDISPLPFVHVFGDYSVSKYKVFSLGAAISIR